MSVNVGEFINERKKKGLQWSTAVLTRKKQLTAEHKKKHNTHKHEKQSVL